MRTLPLHLVLLGALLLLTACSRKHVPDPTPVQTPDAHAANHPHADAPKKELSTTIVTIVRARATIADASRLAYEAIPARAPLAAPFDLLTTPKEARGARDLVLVAVGDVSQPTKQWVDTTMSLKTRAFAPTQHLLDSGDIVFMNLENPVSELSPTAKKTYSFTSHPERLGWYFDVGFNLFSLSNNHIADADQPGIDDTLMHLERYKKERDAHAWWAGAGTTPEEGEQATIFSPPGKDLKIAFFSTGFSKSGNVSKYWSESLVERIKAVDGEVDLVIVSVHAGKEYQHIPEEDLQKRFKAWVDAGADLVIGHHPHVIRPVEVYKERIIFYSLGNYVFASRTVRHRKSGAKMYGLMPRVIIQDGKVTAAEITPTWVNNSGAWVLDSGERMANSNFAPEVITGPFADEFFRDFDTWTESCGATLPSRYEDVGRFLISPPSISALIR